jgi:hypothetical protein
VPLAAPGRIGCETLSLYVPIAWKTVGGPPTLPIADAGVTVNDVIETKVGVAVASALSVISQCRSFPHSAAGPGAGRISGEAGGGPLLGVEPHRRSVKYDPVHTWEPERLVRSQGSPLMRTRPSASPAMVVVTDDIGLRLR